MSLVVLVMEADVQISTFTVAESESKFREFASAVGVEVMVVHENCEIGALSFSSLNLVLVHGRCLSLKGLLDFFGHLYLGGLCDYAISYLAFLTFLGNSTLITGMTTLT